MIRSLLIAIVVAAGTLLGAATASAVTPATSFTYQGVLTESGTPVTTPVDVRFTLYDDAGGTSQVGGPLTIPNITPDEGVFTASLEFGVTPFGPNDALWMRVEVSPAGAGTYDDLGLQPLEATPFALNTRGINVDATGSVGIGTSTPFAKLHVVGDTFTDGAIALSGGLYMTSWDLDGFAGGLYFNENNVATRMFLEAGGNVGIGTTAPQSRLDVRYDSADGNGMEITATGSTPTLGVQSTVAQGTGVRGETTDTLGANYGVYGAVNATNATGWGVFSNGRLGATGTKSFCIDHPLDLANAFLLHYSSESPEPQNRYNGNIILNQSGTAVVQLPDYFQSINTDFRYTLTPIGAPAPNLHVAREIVGNVFVIAGGQPGQKVSWEVTARRNDAFVAQRGAPVEVQKVGAERGRYLTPELYGQPAEAGLLYRPAPIDPSR